MRAEEAWEDLYKKIYNHHYEVLKSEPGESRDAKLSLSNWILDMMTGCEIEEEAQLCEDCVNRVDVLEVINNPLNVKLDEIIKKLPSVQPTRPTGKWIDDDKNGVFVTCSKCGVYHWRKDFVKERGFNYCQYCGAKMEVAD